MKRVCSSLTILGLWLMSKLMVLFVSKGELEELCFYLRKGYIPKRTFAVIPGSLNRMYTSSSHSYFLS